MSTSLLALRTDGAYDQVFTATESAGDASAEAVPVLNDAGVLDPSLLNAATSGANKVLLTGADGRIDARALPVGIVAEAAVAMAAEALQKGQLVHLFNDAGTAAVRLACAATGDPADGYVLEDYPQGAEAQVYFEGANDFPAGAQPGRLFLSDTPGAVSTTAASGTGKILQVVGLGVSSSSMYVRPERPVYLR